MLKESGKLLHFYMHCTHTALFSKSTAISPITQSNITKLYEVCFSFFEHLRILDLAFWIWTCLIRPSSELLDSLQPEVRALGVICHFSSNYRRPLNADDLKAKQFLATWPSFVLMCLISLNWPLFSKQPFVSHQWNLGQTAMMSWATFSECEKVSEPHCEFRNFDASPPPPKKKGGKSASRPLWWSSLQNVCLRSAPYRTYLHIETFSCK